MAEGLHALGRGGREGLCRERPWPRAGWGKQETGSVQSGLLNRTPAAEHGAALGPRGVPGGYSEVGEIGSYYSIGVEFHFCKMKTFLEI